MTPCFRCQESGDTPWGAPQGWRPCAQSWGDEQQMGRGMLGAAQVWGMPALETAASLV